MASSKPRSTRRPRNKAEAEFYDFAYGEGWEVTKRGWPDFFCWVDDGNIMLVEVKRSDEVPLKTHQALVMERLASCGVPCFRWSPDGWLERV